MSTKLDFDVDRLLRGAAELLRDGKQWGQGSGQNGATYCMMSALSEASFHGRLRFETYSLALARLGFASPLDGVHWNDVPGRTVDEVIARLEGAVRADVVEVTNGD